MSCLIDARAILDAARHEELPRLPFFIGATRVGSVAVAHLGLLRELPTGLRVHTHAVTLTLPASERTAWFTAANQQLRAASAIVAWRDETYAVVDPRQVAWPLAPLAHIERAASRFWGTLTFGAHANGYVTDAHGRPSHLWIARRSLHKATDPGLLDNLVGGGVPHDQSPTEALLREAWEEAGIEPALAAHARAVGVLELERDIAEGFQHEQLHAFDLALPEPFSPTNQDGEVAGFECVPMAELLQRQSWHEMTLDAALVTLDFLRRHGFVHFDR